MKKPINIKELLSNFETITIVSKDKSYPINTVRLSGVNELTVEIFDSNLKPNNNERYTILLKSSKGRFIAKDVVIDEVKGVFCVHRLKNVIFEKQELRNYKRVKCIQKITLNCYNNDIEGYICDLSAGGALIKLNTNVKIIRGLLLLEILNEKLQLPFVVIKSYKENNLTCLHIQFDNLEDKLVQKLCQIVFKIEIEERKYKKDL